MLNGVEDKNAHDKRAADDRHDAGEKYDEGLVDEHEAAAQNQGGSTAYFVGESTHHGRSDCGAGEEQREAGRS